MVLEPVETDWAWLDAIAGEFSDDFFSAGRDQPELPSRPQLDGAFESRQADRYVASLDRGVD